MRAHYFSKKLGWVFLLYFVEGFPFGIFTEALPVYLRVHGMPLHDIGMVNLLQLPWSFKIFWGPLVDRYGTPQRWIASALILLAGVHIGLAVVDPQTVGIGLLVLMFGLALASATQDIAIDGFFVRFLNTQESGIGNGLRVTAYRMALIVMGGGSVMLSGWLPWNRIFASLGVMCLGLAVAISMLPTGVTEPSPTWKDWWQGLWQWFKQPGAWGVFAFILLYRLGDVSMSSMIKPFWVDRGISPAEIGLVNTSLGMGATIVGALAGGWFVSQRGVYKGVWVLGLAQAFSNLGYSLVAYGDLGRPYLYSASLVESFCQGLGTAALLGLLTKLCDRVHAATQFAALSAIFGLTRALAGAASGHATESLGFADYFTLTFFLSFPAYAFLPWVKKRLAGVSPAPASAQT